MPSSIADRTHMEEQLREMKRQRTSLARQVGQQHYSDQQFTAINEQINTLEYSLREQYGYGLTDTKNCEERDFDQRAEETGEEFLERLMNEDPFGSPATNSKRKACPTIEEGDEDDESGGKSGQNQAPSNSRTVKETPAARSSKSDSAQCGVKRLDNSGRPTGSAKKRQRTALTSGLDVVLEVSETPSNEPQNSKLLSSHPEISTPKNQNLSPRNPGMTGFDLLMDEPEHGQVGVRSAKPSRSPARPKAKFENGLAAVLMQTPMPHSIVEGEPSSAPVRRPLMTPLSAPAGSGAATADARHSEQGFFTRMWGRLRGRSTTTRGDPPKLEPLIAPVPEEDETEDIEV